MQSMNEFEENLKLLLAERGLTIYQVALSVGEDPSNVQKVLTKKRAVKLEKRLDYLKKFCNSPLLKGIDYNYLANILVSESLEIEPDPIIPHTMPKGTYRIPCLGTVTAGSLAMVEDVQDVIYYGFDHPKCKNTKLFCLKVLGDSMEPKIPDGAIVLVEQVNTFQNGGLYVVLTDDGKSTMKIVSMSQDGLQLIPINKRHKPIDVKGFGIEKIFKVIEYKVRFE